ncbi:MAG: hypothetical protein ACRDHZ_18770 [Ktedonobacteraceae bacterium]
MIQNVPALRMNQQQVAQLMSHLTVYRAYLWQRVIPTPERNHTIHLMQTMQGRLAYEQQQGHADLTFPLSKEEAQTLQRVFSGLMRLHGNAPRSEQRLHMLGEIAALRVLVEHLLRQTQAL